jgi:putative flippase GtrA
MILVRYLSVSVSVYVIILAGMYLLVDRLQIDKTASYVCIYLCAYLAEYALTLTVVFRSDHHLRKVLKFVINTALFLGLGTLLFRLMLWWQVNYLVATVGVALLLLPFRFLTNKYFVYR